MSPVKSPKIPKHIWWGVLLPVVLVGLGVWRLWPKIEEYMSKDERMAMEFLINHSDKPRCKECTGFNNILAFKGIDAMGYQVAPIHSDSLWGVTSIGRIERHYDCTNERHVNTVGYCAYPIVYDWRHRNTFLLLWPKNVFHIDNGGKPVTEWPTDEELAERFSNVVPSNW